MTGGVIKPRHITDRIEVRKGDIVLYNTGYHRFYNGASEEDEERYFLVTRAATASSRSGSWRWSSPGPASTRALATTR